MTEPSGNSSGRQRFGLVLFGALLAGAAAASYFGVRDSWAPAPRIDEPASAFAAARADEVELPPGPHRAEFQASCVLCHSPRLALNQPPFPREKWTEIVHKMVAVYGAPMTPDTETQVVDYLTAIQTDQ